MDGILTGGAADYPNLDYKADDDLENIICQLENEA
jgi:hypothetical protein